MNDPDAHYSVARGVGVLSKHPDADDDEDGPMRVRGVALPENDRTFGGSGEYKYWPRDTIEEAVEGLVGTKIVDDREHDVPDDGDISKIPKQPSARAIVGEVSDARYEPGVGALYEGEIDDPEIASLVENGRIEVSPFVFHEKGEFDADRNATPVSRIVHWRDLATVASGAGTGASIEPMESESGVAAMSAEALSAIVDTSFDGDGVAGDAGDAGEDEVPDPESDEDGGGDDEGDGEDGDVEAEALSFSHLRYDGTSTGKLDESAIPSEGFKSHYLFPGETKSESSFPVVDASGNLRRGNVESAWNLRGDAPGSREDVERILLTLARKFDNPPIDREDADALSANLLDGLRDGLDAAEKYGEESDQNERADTRVEEDEDTAEETDMDLSEEEEKIVNTFRALDDAVVVESETESLATKAEESGLDEVDEPVVLDADEHDEPVVEEKEEIESLRENVEAVTNVLAEALVDQKGVKEKTAASLGVEALVSEFENEAGEFDAEALIQEPKTGDAGAGTTDPSGGSGEPDEEQQAEAEALAESVMTVRDWRAVESESLSKREYVADQYGVDPIEAESESQLRRKIDAQGGD